MRIAIASLLPPLLQEASLQQVETITEDPQLTSQRSTDSAKPVPEAAFVAQLLRLWEHGRGSRRC